MRFLMITNPGTPGAPPPTPEAFATLARLSEEMSKKGILVDTGGLQAEGTKVRSVDGTFSVLDGPYTEAKEMIAGYAIVDVDSFEQAAGISRQFYEIMGDGEGEIIPMYPAGADLQ